MRNVALKKLVHRTQGLWCGIVMWFNRLARMIAAEIINPCSIDTGQEGRAAANGSVATVVAGRTPRMRDLWGSR